MSRWFRLYDELLDDPKVQRLHPALFKVLINLWCVASRHDGRLPSHQDTAFALRMSEDETFRAVSKLSEAGLIDTDSDTGEQRPHGWDNRQYRSDVSTDRVRSHRERRKSAKKPGPPGAGAGKKSGQGNVDETFHATPPEADTETDSSVADATGTVVPISAAAFCKAVFDSAVKLLRTSDPDLREREARSVVGRWRKTMNDDARLLSLIAEAEGKSNPLEWLMAAVEKPVGQPRFTRQSDPGSLRGSRPNPALDLLHAARAAEAAEAERGDRADHRGAWPALPALGGS